MEAGAEGAWSGAAESLLLEPTGVKTQTQTQTHTHTHTHTHTQGFSYNSCRVTEEAQTYCCSSPSIYQRINENAEPDQRK